MKLRKANSSTFVVGAGSILDLGAVTPTMPIPTRPRARSVQDALRSDAVRVGRDIQSGIERERVSDAAET